MAELDLVLHRFFEKARWERALDGGVGKGLNYGTLRDLAKPQTRVMLYRAISSGKYEISAPRCVRIPKDEKGEFREVYINDDLDRVVLGIANDLFFDLMPGMVHPSCRSYTKGVGCGKIVRGISSQIVALGSEGNAPAGWKADLSRYFDSVPLNIIDSVFDKIEDTYGKSALVGLIRRYYHSDDYIGYDGVPGKKYMSLRQGCAVSAFLANAVLYDIDAKLSRLDGHYVRYSDDMVFVGLDWRNALEILKTELQKMDLRLNPKKLSLVTGGQWFNFLGFSIKGGLVSLSPSQIKKFQNEVRRRTMRKGVSYETAVRRINSYLYVGNGEYSWATRMLPYINSAHDIRTLNAYILDCLRSVRTGHRRIGGLGYDRFSETGCVSRGRGRNVRRNRDSAPENLDGYMSIGCMQMAMNCSKEVYEALVRTI